MTKDELQKQVLEALSSGKLNPTTIIMGDNVQNKIEKVESGGVVNITGGQMDEQSDSEPVQEDQTPDIPLFKYIHPSVTTENEKRQIHSEVENLVRHFPLPDICRHLRQLRSQNRVYINIKPELMFEELHRLGMPDESTPGFTKKNFMNYFNIND